MPPQPPRPLSPKSPHSSSYVDHPETPRKRKVPVISALRGLNPLRSNETIDSLKTLLRKYLNLQFEIDDWQVAAIQRIRQGYDSILVAGTGHRKSLVFHGLAVLDPKKIIIVIAPLKALERDQARVVLVYYLFKYLNEKQVNEAQAKKITAAMVNENTVSRTLWKELREGRHQLYYVSPEMALSETFKSLWQDRKFSKRVQAVIVDEASM